MALPTPSIAAVTLSLVLACAAHVHAKTSPADAPDDSHSVEVLSQQVQDGNTQAMNTLGNRYLTGDGIPQDGAQAVRLFQQAAQAGDADGAMHLGRAYFRGRGVPSDRRQALFWFQNEDRMRKGRSPLPAPSADNAPPKISGCNEQVKPEMLEGAMQSGNAGVVTAYAMVIGGKMQDVVILSGPRIYQAAVRQAFSGYRCNGDGWVLQHFTFDPSTDFRRSAMFWVASREKYSEVELPTFDANWTGLSAEQRRIVRARYKQLPADHEPPYPVDGMGALAEDLRALLERWQWWGPLDIELSVDPAGTVSSVRMPTLPDAQFGPAVTDLLMRTRFKPARCADAPCSMRFPIALDIGRTDNSDQDWLLGKRAADGDAQAQNRMGERHETGKSAKRDIAAALDWYRKAAAHGDPRGQHNLARLLEAGGDIAKDPAQALDLYRAAAQQGYAPSQYRYARLLDEGRSTPIDTAQALAWFEKSAAQGYVWAQFSLGRAYEWGLGVEKNFAKAHDFYQLAADNGDKHSWKRLAALNFAWDGNPSGRQEVLRWLMANAASGDSDVSAQLGGYYAHGVGVDRDTQAAFRLYLQSAKKGSRWAQVQLAYCYESGRGTAADQAQAFHWYEKAHARGHPAATMRLAAMHREGRGTEKDPEMAVKLESKAVDRIVPLEWIDLMQTYTFGLVAERNPQQGLVAYRDASRDEFIAAHMKFRSVIERQAPYNDSSEN